MQADASMNGSAATGLNQPVMAYVALGANLGNARDAVLQALSDLGAAAHTRVGRVSSLYKTAPVDATGPDFINAVAQVSTTLNAQDFLAWLQGMEAAAGRERPYPNAPRTLDLDILLFGDQVISTPNLIVPHPRMYLRAFVLVPLAEIAPDRVPEVALAAVRGQSLDRLLPATTAAEGQASSAMSSISTQAPIGI